MAVKHPIATRAANALERVLPGRKPLGSGRELWPGVGHATHRKEAMPEGTRPDSPENAPVERSAAPTVVRVVLGTQLRKLREARGITAQEAARAIRGSESKISRIELGRNAVREIDIADLLNLYGVTDPAEQEYLLTLASQANQQGWWYRYQDVLPAWFITYLGLEESADSIRSFDAQFVPALLQTEEYSAAVIGLRESAADKVDKLIDLRAERQRRFWDSGRKLWAVIDEMALRRPVGNQAIMQRQLEHLLAAGARPTLTMQVTPFRTGSSYVAPATFSILDFARAELPDMVYLEHLTNALYLDRPPDVSQYAEALSEISASSTAPEQTADFIQGMLAELA